MERGLVTNWDAMENIYRRVFFNELKVDPEDHPVLLTEPFLNPKANREKALQVMFELLRSPAVYIITHSALTLYASRRTAGVVLNCGEGMSTAVPIFEGFALPHAASHLAVSGSDITDYLAELLEDRGRFFMPAERNGVVRALKEKVCYVAPDYEAQTESADRDRERLELAYDFPDGSCICLCQERFQAAEVLFRPSLIGKGPDGISSLIYNSIMQADSDVRVSLYSSIILSGGTTLLAGFPERLRKDLKAQAPKWRMQVLAPKEREHSAWMGGSIFASMTTFQQLWIARDEYEEAGPAIVHKKCA
eukprot:TRINITY_DN17572_c0_g3_i5.p1 TRINITY_DN17572_c0_g3~~TRINITY_DN17572_c0_g3_i5.p1  ORF type:complete len:306 (+),score=54.81 TRINITY_DN17572_c0_g3_i5:690-1607(+)